MRTAKWKKVVAGVVSAVVLTVLPFTVTAKSDEGTLGLAVTSNAACGVSGQCCFEIGAICKGGELHHRYYPGGCLPW